MLQGSPNIEIPVIILKSSFDARERRYKCNICGEIQDRLFKYEDHWIKHLINGQNSKALPKFGHGMSRMVTQAEDEKPFEKIKSSAKSVKQEAGIENDSDELPSGKGKGKKRGSERSQVSRC